jgi:PAS domain S-box-containing protein
MKVSGKLGQWDMRLVLGLFALVLLGYVWGSTWYQLRAAKSEALEAGRRDVANYARTLEEHTIRTVQDVDQTAIFLSLRYHEVGRALDIAGYLKKGVISGDIYNQIALLDPKGDLQLSSLPFTPMNLADREHFKVHVPVDSGQLFISKPVLGRLSKKWSIQMSRRISSADGQFKGVLVVSVNPQYFTRFYDDIHLGKDGLVTLAGSDGIVRARRAGGGTEVGQNIAKGVAFRAAQANGRGELVATSLLDGRERIFAYRKVNGYPLFVFVAIGTADVLQAYHSRQTEAVRLASITSALLLAFCAFVTIIFGRLLASQKRAVAADAAKSVLLDDLAHQQQALTASSARLDAIVYNAGDGILTIGADGAIESANRAAGVIFGYASEQLLALNIGQLTPGLPADYWQAAPGLTSSTGQRQDGQAIFLEIAASQVQLHGQPQWILMVRDITERHRVERLQQEFVSTVSHELRTPLTSIRGALGLIDGGAAGALPERMVQLVRMAYSNTERLTRLINDLLDVQKLESGVLSMTLANCHLPQLINDALAANAAFAQRFGTQITLEGTIPAVLVQVDAGRFDQVMANLLSNACKYAGKEGVVTVTCLLIEAERVQIEVCDNGPGIPEAFRHRIFQKFAQADGSSTKSQGGSGLGLSIAKAIITQMHGEIGYQSVAGQGSCFYFCLPVVGA